jgi:hypothetical protein
VGHQIHLELAPGITPLPFASLLLDGKLDCAILLSKIITLFTSPYSGGGADGIQDTGKASPQKDVRM